MTNLQRLVLVLAFIFAVLLGVLVATTLFGGKSSSPKPSASPSSSQAASLAPTAGTSSEPSAAAASPSAVPSPTPSPTAKPVAVATIQFVSLALDARNDTGGATRTIAFTAQKGAVTVKLSTESGGNTKACLLADGKQVACRTATGGTLSYSTSKKSANLQLTLRGDGAATPVVNVTITFAAQKPKVTVSNARFDGTGNAAYNGLQVVATPRAKGNYQVSASWGGHPFTYEVDLIEQGGPGLKTVKPSTGATKTTQAFAVVPPHPWMIVLKNTESGFGTTNLTATFTWP